jgi:transposase
MMDEYSAYERRHAILRAYDMGAQQTEIAAHLGISQARVWQLIEKAKKELAENRIPPGMDLPRPLTHAEISNWNNRIPAWACREYAVQVIFRLVNACAKKG